MPAASTRDTWQRAQTLATTLCRETNALPVRGESWMATRLRDGALSVTECLAAGRKRAGAQDTADNLHKAAAACNELEYLVTQAEDLGCLAPEARQRLCGEVLALRKATYGLMHAH